jgi:hypothetical protein
VLLDTTVPEFCKAGIIGDKGPGILDPSDPSPPMVENEKPPAPVVPTDLGPGQVHRAPGFLCPGLVPEERAGVREYFKDFFVIEQFALIGIDRNRGVFIRVIIVDEEPVIPVFFLYDMDISEITAALPALETFKRQA